MCDVPDCPGESTYMIATWLKRPGKDWTCPRCTLCQKHADEIMELDKAHAVHAIGVMLGARAGDATSGECCLPLGELKVPDANQPRTKSETVRIVEDAIDKAAKKNLN